MPRRTRLESGLQNALSILALDLGGSNVRVLLARLTGDGREPQVLSEKFKLEPEHVSTTGEALFGAIARFIKEFLAGRRLGGSYPLGFTFSFPIRQPSIRRGELILWTKGWTASGVEGRDVVSLLEQALEGQGVGGVRVVSYPGGKR